MATARAPSLPKSIWGKIIQKIALKRARSRKRKLGKLSLAHVRELPEHTKRDIGWTNM